MRTDTAVLDNVDFGFAENGLIAYKLGQPLDAASFIAHVGEEEYKKLVNFVLHYIADLDIPIKRCASYLPLLIQASAIKPVLELSSP